MHDAVRSTTRGWRSAAARARCSSWAGGTSWSGPSTRGESLCVLGFFVVGGFLPECSQLWTICERCILKNLLLARSFFLGGQGGCLMCALFHLSRAWSSWAARATLVCLGLCCVFFCSLAADHSFLLLPMPLPLIVRNGQCLGARAWERCALW